MNVRRALFALACATALAGPVAARQVFKSGTDLVLLNVTVVDAAGHLVTGLTQEDFQVFEDGVQQTVTNFSRDPQPIALSLLLDTSTSMERKLPIAQEAATGFARRLDRARRRADHRLRQPDADSARRSPTTRPRSSSAIRRTQAGGSTSLYNALYTRAQRARSASVARRRTTSAARRSSLLSDGEDTTSLMTYEDVLDLAKRSETWRLRDRPARQRATRRCTASGTRRTSSCGRSRRRPAAASFFVEDVTQLPAIYSQIADELANQYTIGYISKNAKRDGAWRQVTVQVVNGRTRRPAPRRATSPPKQALSDAAHGRVFIIGAGPGDPGLITARGVRLLAEADVVVYDRAVEAVLRWARPDAERIAAGAPAERETAQDAISMLARREGARRPSGRAAQVGRSVRVRQRREGSAVPARAGRAVRSRSRRPGRDWRAGVRRRAAHLSRRRATRSCSCAATRARSDSMPDVDWDALARIDGHARLLRGRPAGAVQFCRRCSTTARTPDSAAALIYRGTQPDAATVTGTIAELLDATVDRRRRRTPALLVVGEVAEPARITCAGSTSGRSSGAASS